MKHASNIRWLLLGAWVCWPGPWQMAAQASAAPEPTQEAETQEVTLDTLIQQARRNSPGLQAKQRAYEAARGRVIAAWLPDDPAFGADVEGQPDLFEFNRRTDTEYMAMQTIPFPTKLILRGQIAARETQMAYQRYKEEERSVIWHLEQPYYELYMTKQTLASLREVRLLLDKLSHAVQARYETNQTSLQDLLKAQIERSKIDIEIFELEQREHLAEAHLSHLLNQPLEISYAIPEAQPRQPITVSLPELERLALRMRPELLAFDIGIKRAKAGRLLTVTNWLPDVTGRIESRQFKGEGGIREHDTFIGVTVPVWSLLKGVGGEWRSANQEVREAEALYTEMKNEVLLAVHEAYAKVKSSEHAFDTYKHFILPQTEQQVEVALAAYEAGRTDFLDLIDAERMLRDAQIAYYKVRAEYDMGLSDLRLAVGGDFQNVQTVSPSKGALP